MTTTIETSRSKATFVAKMAHAPGSNLRNGNLSSDAKTRRAVTDSTPRGGNGPLGPNIPCAASGPILADPYLAMASKALDELEDARKANENRLRQLQDPETFNLPANNPQVLQYAIMVEDIKTVEDSTIKQLEKLMRNHPLGALQQQLIGVGAKQLARLLGAIRDPYWNDHPDIDAPRTFGQLKAYCGLHVVNGKAPARHRANKCRNLHHSDECNKWNADAKMRLWNIAGKTIMFNGEPDKNGNPRPRSPYRDIYDQAREKYAESTHSIACVRCGPSGKPAQPGSPLSDGHKHARAITLVMVEILRDLYCEATRLHQGA